MDLTDTYRTFYPKATEYILLECIWNILQENLIKHLSKQQWMKLEINYKRKTAKFTNMWRLSNMLLNNPWFKKEIKKYLEKMKIEIQKLWDGTKAVLKRGS